MKRTNLLSIMDRWTAAITSWAYPAAVIVVWIVVAALTIVDLTTVRPSIRSIDAPRSVTAGAAEGGLICARLKKGSRSLQIAARCGRP